MHPKLFSNPYFFTLIILIIALILFKIPHLHLPYYWDESWVYGHGSRLMCVTGPGISPSSLPVDISRGHPLLFYFLTSIWLKIFGNTVFSSHVFSLVVSIALVIAVYAFCAEFFSKRVGFFASLILMFQSVFLAQSCVVLPEVMLALWVILAIRAFYSGKKVWYVLFATFMLLTKETGLVCVVAIFMNELISDWFVSNEIPAGKARWLRPLKNYKNYLIIIFPLLIASVHFIIQKKIYGWFFFPEHMNYISFKWAGFSDKFKSAFAYSCIYYGRNSLLFGGLFCAIVLMIRKKKDNVSLQTQLQNKILSGLGLYILVFLSFSSVNFYLERYMMSCIVAFIILFVYFIDKALSKNVLKWVAVSGIICTFIYYDATVVTSSDHNLGYVKAVETYEDCVNYCIAKNYKNKIIFTNYLMVYALGDTLSGYLNGANRFSAVSSHFNKTTELCIFSNVEPTHFSDSIKNNCPMTLIKKFDRDKVSLELYEVKR
jgi:4-amino-4-deoxy-L-arabinose transferase-like glycosyltransferase